MTKSPRHHPTCPEVLEPHVEFDAEVRGYRAVRRCQCGAERGRPGAAYARYHHAEIAATGRTPGGVAALAPAGTIHRVGFVSNPARAPGKRPRSRPRPLRLSPEQVSCLAAVIDGATDPAAFAGGPRQSLASCVQRGLLTQRDPSTLVPTPLGRAALADPAAYQRGELHQLATSFGD